MEEKVIHGITEENKAELAKRKLVLEDLTIGDRFNFDILSGNLCIGTVIGYSNEFEGSFYLKDVAIITPSGNTRELDYYFLPERVIGGVWTSECLKEKSE